MSEDTYTGFSLPNFPSLTTVRLYESTLKHILEEHAEFAMLLPSHIDGLATAIGNPTSIHTSTTNPDKAVVIVSNSFRYFNDPVHIPVRIIDDTSSGRITTAYFSSGTYRGAVLWSAGNV